MSAYMKYGRFWHLPSMTSTQPKGKLCTERQSMARSRPRFVRVGLSGSTRPGTADGVSVPWSTVSVHDMFESVLDRPMETLLRNIANMEERDNFRTSGTFPYISISIPLRFLACASPRCWHGSLLRSHKHQYEYIE